MFFGVGYKEHLVVVVAEPYGDSMFDGTLEVMSVSADKRLAVLMGSQAQISQALQAWDAEAEGGKPVELGELFTKATVAMLMDNPWKPMLRAPALFIAEGAQVKCIPCEEEKAYSLCAPGDEAHPTMQELARAIMDYETAVNSTSAQITEHVAQFILSSFNLPSGAVIRYINFKTNESLAVHHGTPPTTH